MGRDDSESWVHRDVRRVCITVLIRVLFAKVNICPVSLSTVPSPLTLVYENELLIILTVMSESLPCSEGLH